MTYKTCVALATWAWICNE